MKTDPRSGKTDERTTVIVPLPKRPNPIIVLGAGGIVSNAHLPAYQKAKFPVIGIADLSLEKAAKLQSQHAIGHAFGSIAEAVAFAPHDAVFDLAVPAAFLLDCLKLLPQGAAVLMQKPMGETLTDAIAILDLCRKKRLKAAVNFQLRWSPNLFQAMKLMQRGELGSLHDFELQVSCRMPWEQWPFLQDAPRLEILYHSIHYLDLARAWLGEPLAVYARTVRSPCTPHLAATKSVITLDYGDWVRCYVATDHSNNFGFEYQRSFVQVEGTKAAVHARIGVDLDYPHGKPDTLDFSLEGGTWRSVPISGNWFPDAFIGSMASLQCFVEGSSNELPTSVEDAIHTMALVEAAYKSSSTGGTPIAIPSTS